jgi:hypothetical protein
MPTVLAIAAGGVAFVGYGLSAGRRTGLEAALTFAACTAAVTALLAGFERAGTPVYVTPNEATWRSFRSGMLVGVGAFVLLGAVAGGFTLLLVPGPDAVARALSVAVAFGFQLALVIAMTCGLGSAAQHWLLRVLLWRAGVVPLRFGRFLDYAVSLKLLYRSGGGGSSSSTACCRSTLREATAAQAATATATKQREPHLDRMAGARSAYLGP